MVERCRREQERLERLAKEVDRTPSTVVSPTAAAAAAAATLKSPPPPEQQLRQTLSRQISRERVRSDTSAENLVQSAVA
jgi:hypothetical protein